MSLNHDKWEWVNAIDKEGDLVGVRVMIMDTYERCSKCGGEGCNRCQNTGLQPSFDYKLLENNKLIGFFGE